MQIVNSAIRTSGQRQHKVYILAAIVAAIVPTVAAALFVWLVPAGCDIRGDAAIYRWTCLLPGLLIVVPVAVAFLLLLANLLNHRSGHRYPDGWLVTILGAGLLTQLILIGSYLLVLDPAYRGLMLGELMLIPQPFVAGAISGTVFWLTLHLATRIIGLRQGHDVVRSYD